MHRIRAWASEWADTVAVITSVLGVFGLTVAVVSLWFQYGQLISAQQETTVQYRLMRDMVKRLETQNEFAKQDITARTADLFFNRYDDEEYRDFMQTIKVVDLSAESEESLKSKLDPGFKHFTLTWHTVLGCREPFCDVFDLLHYNTPQRDICDLALSDSTILRDALLSRPDISSDQESTRAVQEMIIGDVMCHCPSDWTSWGIETSSFCRESNETEGNG